LLKILDVFSHDQILHRKRRIRYRARKTEKRKRKMEDVVRAIIRVLAHLAA